MPILRSRNPDITTLRSLGISVFRPQSDHVFVVSILPQLKVYCLAALYEQGGRMPRGRLAGHFLGCEDLIGTIAAELYVNANGKSVSDESDDSEDEKEEGGKDARSNSPLEEAMDHFTDLKDTDPETYQYWWWLTQVLMETVPLGLPTSLLTVLLEGEYGWEDVNESQVELLKSTLVAVVYEFEDFLDDHILNRLTRVLGLTSAEAVDRLLLPVYAQIADGTLRADLFEKREENPMWRFIRQLRRDRSAVVPRDDEIVARVLKHFTRTAAGRVIGPAFHSEMRRQQVLLASDEVMKAIAYTLVAKGFALAAVGDNQFVLEIPKSDATEEFLEQVARLAIEAERKILGRFVAPCRCSVQLSW